jgi:hypothetical protein
MNNKTRLLISLLMASSSLFAEPNPLADAATGMLKESATAAVPSEAVQGAAAVGKAQALQEGVKNAPAALEGQAKGAVTDAVKQQVNNAASVAVKPVDNSVAAVDASKAQVAPVATSTPAVAEKPVKAAKNKAYKKSSKKKH